MKGQIQVLVGVLKLRMEDMTDEERLEVFTAMRDAFCPDCGGKQSINFPCQCQNDD